MKQAWTLFLLLISFSLVLSAQEEKADDQIFWSDWYKLEWVDFQGQDKPSGEGIAALSNIALPYRYVSDGEGVLGVTINVCFVKSKSWSNPEKQNNVLLQHERLHFDIAELHRRMIIKEISNTKFDKENYKQQLETIIEEIWDNKYRDMQDKYDAETNFSRIIREQINWNKFVSQQLKNYEAYQYNNLEISLIQFD